LKRRPHPEGGYYREIQRAPERVSSDTPADGRSAYTGIYFLLAGEDYSAWHRITSDETWFFRAGCDFVLYVIDNDGAYRSAFRWF
jgi:uncharacterized protein